MECYFSSVFVTEKLEHDLFCVCSLSFTSYDLWEWCIQKWWNMKNDTHQQLVLLLTCCFKRGLENMYQLNVIRNINNAYQHSGSTKGLQGYADLYNYDSDQTFLVNKKERFGNTSVHWKSSTQICYFCHVSCTRKD